LLEIIRNQRVKALPQDFERLSTDFKNQLEDSKNAMQYYGFLIEENTELPKSEPKLLLEVVAGYDINLGKSKSTPFVEIIQN
jgi:hypothetical protein